MTLIVNIFGGPGIGKAQPLYSKIRTPDGWTTMGEIKVGDEVLTPNGFPTEVTHTHDQGKQKIYTVTLDDGSKTECCGEHLWQCKVNYSSENYIISTNEIKRHLKRKSTISVPSFYPTILAIRDDTELPILPYILGNILGKSPYITHIPSEYLISTVEQRLALLQGITDSSNYKLLNDRHCIIDLNPVMALQVLELLRSLGCIASIQQSIQDEFPTITFDHPRIHVLFRTLEEFPPLKLKTARRTIKSIEYKGIEEARCITISHPESLYVTDDYIVTHNSTTAAGVFHQLKLQQINCELVTEYAKEKVWEESFKILDNQIFVFAQQHHKVFRCLNKVDVIVTDSPVNLGLIFGDMYGQIMSQQFRNLIEYEFSKQDNLNVVLERTIPYDEVGRVQSEDEAKEIDNGIIKVLEDGNHDFLSTPSCPHAADHIFKMILDRLK